MPSAFTRLRDVLLLLVLVAAFAGQGMAATGPVATARTPHVLLTLHAEQAVLAPGTTAWLGLHFRLRPNWHLYWRNPGDSGYPPRIAWRLPAGVSAGDIQWPAPQRLPFGPLTNFGYSDQVMLIVPLHLASDFAPHQLQAVADVNWLVCEESCVPESATVGLTLPVAANARDDVAQQTRFAQARAAWPATQPPMDWRLHAQPDAAGVQLRVGVPPGQPPQTIEFFPYAEGLMDAAAAQTTRREGDHLVVDLRAADPPLAPWRTLNGVVVHRTASDGAVTHAFEVSLPIAGVGEVSGEGAAVLQPARLPGLLPTLLLAFVGGVLLNLMPCVFPVLSIKLLALIGHSPPEPRQQRRHALLYAVGVVFSFLTLALAVLVLRAGGHALGWGFQLQSPIVVSLLALLFFTLGLSLAGGLPIATLAQDAPSTGRARHPDGDALASGVLAVLVASPCTAPFMGAALGAAFLLSTPHTLAIFTVLAVGMALPLVLLLCFPGLQRRLPRPGAWMERLKELLALPLFATVVWLAWVLVEQVGAAAIVTLGSGLVGVGLLAWCVRLRHDLLRRSASLLALLVAIGVCVGPWWPSATNAPGNAPPAVAAAERVLPWLPWTSDALATARAQRQAVLVDFTAAWCITCQVNKRLVLDRPDVLNEIAAARVLTLRADWTRQDTAITAELGRLGRSGVPVYALYPAHGPARLLPEILTPATVIDAVRAVARAEPHPS